MFNITRMNYWAELANFSECDLNPGDLWPAGAAGVTSKNDYHSKKSHLFYVESRYRHRLLQVFHYCRLSFTLGKQTCLNNSRPLLRAIKH